MSLPGFYQSLTSLNLFLYSDSMLKLWTLKTFCLPFQTFIPKLSSTLLTPYSHVALHFCSHSSFLYAFKIQVGSKQSVLSTQAACIILSSLLLIYTSKPAIANTTQSSMDIKPLKPFFQGTYNLSTSGYGCDPQ